METHVIVTINLTIQTGSEQIPIGAATICNQTRIRACPLGAHMWESGQSRGGKEHGRWREGCHEELTVNLHVPTLDKYPL